MQMKLFPQGESLKVTESKGSGAESLHSHLCACAHACCGEPSHWARSGHGGSLGEDVKVNFTTCTERGPLASLFLNSHEITIAIAKVSETKKKKNSASP